LIEAGLTVFAERGLELATLDDVAATAGFTKARSTASSLPRERSCSACSSNTRRSPARDRARDKTFIVGIYGMNFEHMPEIRQRWGYPAVMGLMGVVILGIAWWFHRRGWLGGGTPGVGGGDGNQPPS